MELDRFIAVLNDVVTDMEDDTFTELKRLATLLPNGKTTEINELVDSIEQSYRLSPVNNYPPSKTQILDRLGATKYVGNTGLQEFRKVLNANAYNVTGTVAALQIYTQNRTEYYNLLEGTFSRLLDLNFHTHTQEEHFEVGILMPEQYTKNKIAIVTKELNQWDKVFKTLKEVVGEPPEDTEIASVDNGSLDFFINNGVKVAGCLSLIITGIVQLYQSIQKFQAAKDELKNLGLNANVQKSIEKQERQIFNDGIDKLALDVIKQFATKSLEEGRKNELTIAVKGHTKYVAKCIGEGILIEITPPDPDPPLEEDEADTAEQKKEKQILSKKYQSTLEGIKIVQESMNLLKTLGKVGSDTVKYLTDGDGTTDDTTETPKS